MVDVDLGDLSGLDDGEVVAVAAGVWEVAVCRVQGDLYAVEDLCSHAETTLSDGLLSGYQLVCPLHGASFDVRTGEHSGPPAWCGVPCFRVREEGGSATISVPAKRGGAAGGGAYGGPQTEFRTR
jgi:3-phenylpropionate/trans-cinnamate dioxygenase ferredoxin subunit